MRFMWKACRVPRGKSHNNAENITPIAHLDATAETAKYRGSNTSKVMEKALSSILDNT